MLFNFLEVEGVFKITLNSFVNSEEENIPQTTNKLSFYAYLVEKGYYFDKKVIENYLLSLKVKPFVIFVGNSGTGKTKLSQLYAQYLMKNGNCESSDIITSVKVGKSFSSGGWSLSSKDIQELVPSDKYEGDLDIVVDGIPANGKLNVNTRIFFKSNSLQNHLKELYDEDPNQKIDLVIKQDKNNQDNGEFDGFNYKIIPIGANWTENRHILGYYNVITESYQSTPTFDLIKHAQKNKNDPFFLILDEMNMSHVERYFADFLSAIESGESIPLYSDENNVYELDIPKNLLIVGTVNVDETTYMFSPKVLDRANVLEFEALSVNDYMNFNFDNEYSFKDMDYLLNPLNDIEIRNYSILDLMNEFNGVKTENNGNLWIVLSNELELFQNVLKKAGFDFGFRVINEFLKFMLVAWRYEGSPNVWDNWERYFDAQIKQKMLPKLHGSEKAIGSTIGELFNLCLVERNNNEQVKYFELSEYSVKYFESAIKLQKMANTLSNQRYVSFIN